MVAAVTAQSTGQFCRHSPRRVAAERESPLDSDAHATDETRSDHAVVPLDLVSAAKVGLRRAAQTMGISVTTVRALVAKGDLPAIRIGGKKIVLLRDVEHFLKSRYGTQKAAEPRFHKQINPLPQAVLESPHLRR